LTGRRRIYDLHVHTPASPDAAVTPQELVAAAELMGLWGLGLVVHVDFHPDDHCTGGPDIAAYLADSKAITELASKTGIRVSTGLEIGEPHRFAKSWEPVAAAEEWDFLVGALHWIGSRLILDDSGYRGIDPMQVVEGYYEETLRVLRRCDIDVLAHMGIFRRGLAQAGYRTGFDEVREWPSLIDDVLGTMIEQGVALEVNTAGLRRPEEVTYPTRSVLERYRRLGGELVTLGSDTHRRENAFFGISRGSSLLRELGFREACYFSGRTPRFYRL
jgi:histidinol-phosphatase (PHP family)